MARQADLLSVEDARMRILARFGRLEPESVGLDQVSGRVLASGIRSPITIPPFSNSSMDGFALRSEDTSRAEADRTVRLDVAQHIAAGAASAKSVGPGECARIMTGAPLPPGADAVIPFEDVEDRGTSIEVPRPVDQSACVRRAGQDVRVGDQVLPVGTVLHAAQIGLLAALGIADVEVTRRPRVGILSTGDELVLPGTALRPGQIYNSNTPMLAAAVAEAGATPVPCPVARDTPEALASSLRALPNLDLLLTSGGASVGDFDHVKDVIGAAGSLAFWRVRVRPGKPLLFGTFGDMPVLGLPGNPTSAMVTFEEFARPAIRTMLGAAPMRPEIEAVVDDFVENHGGRRTYARVTLTSTNGRFHAHLAGPQDSAMLAPLAHADGLLLVPETVEALSPGQTGTVQVWRLPASQVDASGAVVRQTPEGSPR